jgi:hypothetical protein
VTDTDVTADPEADGDGPGIRAGRPGRLAGVLRRRTGAIGDRAGAVIAAGRRAVRANLPLVVVALGVGALVWLVATEVFPYHSVNDDESVYLTQAALLLDGQVYIRPGPFGDAVRPWFFVTDATPDGFRYYSKYTPGAAAVFAVGLAVGAPRASLAAVAALSAALVGLLARDAFDRTTGVVAAGALATSPLFVLSSSVFLSYAPATAANLAFAVAYVRSYRAGTGASRLRWAVLAGAAAGVAFHVRSYTAVLFAAPFIAHTGYRLLRAIRGDRRRRRRAVTRAVATALPGLAFVALALAYNATVTGAPFTFPYRAFGPHDGLGFGRRELLGYTEVYTPALGVESTAEVVRMVARRWGPAGPVGTVLALAGLASLRRGWWPRTVDRRRRQGSATGRTDGGAADLGLSDRTLRVLLVGVAVAVIAGEAYFWGTLNGLRNGLIDLLGPYYHFDLLVPLSAFAAAAAVRGWRRLRGAAARRLTPTEVRGVLLVAAVVAAAVVGGATASAMADPLSENRERTANLADTYEPFAEPAWEPRVAGTDATSEADPARPGPAVVFLPSPYGDWLGHPFQVLRNGPDLGGPALYLIDDPPDDDLRALGATDRVPYRYTYRGSWQGATSDLEPELTRLRVLEGDRIAAETTVGVPARARSASIRVEEGGEYARYEATPTGETMTVNWSFTGEGIAVAGRERAVGPARVPYAGDANEVTLLVTFVDSSGASVTYRQEVTVGVGEYAGEDGAVRAVWPPETRVCRLRTDCGREATWVGPGGDYIDGVSVATDARVVDRDE